MSGGARERTRHVLREAYLRGRRLISGALVERRWGIETAREVDLEALGLSSEHRVRYEPSGWLDLRRILKPADVGPGDVFVDLGAGKGRILLQAARYPFKRVVGVELSPRLAAVAQENIVASRESLCCRDIEVVVADAVEYEIPDDATVIYMYNPFSGPVFEAVVDNLLASVARRPRRVRVVYRTPLERERLEATGRFTLERSVAGLRPGRAWAQKMSIRMYVVEPEEVP